MKVRSRVGGERTFFDERSNDVSVWVNGNFILTRYARLFYRFREKIEREWVKKNVKENAIKQRVKNDKEERERKERKEMKRMGALKDIERK